MENGRHSIPKDEGHHELPNLLRNSRGKNEYLWEDHDEPQRLPRSEYPKVSPPLVPASPENSGMVRRSEDETNAN